MNDIVNQETGPKCPVCGEKAIQRKSTVTRVTRHSSPHYELEWQCTQCEMNFSAETAGNETNAERIRKMNDEELAESRIDPIHHYCRSENQMWIGDFCGIADSKKEALQMELKWLKSHEI